MNTLTLLGLVGAAAVLALGGYLLLRWRRPKEETLYYFQCPGCRRKFRYRARQAGHAATCPRCKQHLTFPQTSGGRAETDLRRAR
jgi:hypothetical protein